MTKCFSLSLYLLYRCTFAVHGADEGDIRIFSFFFCFKAYSIFS